MSQATIERLCKLKLWQLRYSAFLMGVRSSGPKSDLAHGICQALAISRPYKPTQRVLSVDMGIRNLAYCVLDASVNNHRDDRPTTALVKTWKRVDLTAKQHDGSAAEGADPEDDMFKPPVLAKTAYNITRELLHYEPDVLLIEQQRWRSGGAAGVQQWTIRVNTLESQLWACLQTLQAVGKVGTSAFPDAYQIDPKRVAEFFPICNGATLRFSNAIRSTEDYRVFEAALRKPADSASGKKQKVDTVRSWLRGDQPGDVSLSFEGSARSTADMFETRAGKTIARRPAHALEGRRSAVKIDDLADCLLQGVTWLRWQENHDMTWLLERLRAQDD